MRHVIVISEDAMVYEDDNILNDLRQREKEITKVITKDISEEDKATFKKVLEQMQKNCSDLLKQNKN